MAKGAKEHAKPVGARNAFVLDCSLVFAWFFPDESGEDADQVARSLAASEAIVPSLWPLEVANALVVGERRGRCTPAQSTAFLARLASLPIRVDDQTALAAWSDTLPLARCAQLSAYDAAYLELAIREALPLATFDGPLRAVAESLGVKLLRA